jgi:two-component system sensor histidine kinase RegB
VTLSEDAVGENVRFAIEDRGAGMPPEVLARVGEPFFTTKPPGRGMGLGVFLARAVVERQGGSLRLRSTVGEGTTAQLELPRAPHG